VPFCLSQFHRILAGWLKTRVGILGHDGTAVEWQIGSSHDHIGSVAFSANGSRLVSAFQGGTVGLWDAQTGRHFATLNGHFDSASLVTFSSDGSSLAMAFDDKTMQLWEGKTDILPPLSTLASDILSGWLKTRLGVNHTPRLWDGETGACIATLEGHLKTGKFMTFSVDGSRLASAHFGGAIRVHNGWLKARLRF